MSVQKTLLWIGTIGGHSVCQFTRAMYEANLGVEKLHIRFRLATDLRLLDRRRYEFAARSLDEVGRMICGWIHADRARLGTAPARRTDRSHRILHGAGRRRPPT
jgi:hypothetical protein